MFVTPVMQHALAPNLFDPINWPPLLPLRWRCSWLLCCLPHSRFAHSAAYRPDGPDLLYTPPYSALVCKKHYAAWPARHRESNHFIKMIGLVREISSQKIRRQLAWTYSDPTLQVWNLAQTKSYLVKLAKVNSTKTHKAACCSHFSWKCNIRCWCVYAHISVHNPAFLARRFLRRWQSALTSATRTNTGKLTTRGN